jgi:hypothetical protein
MEHDRRVDTLALAPDQPLVGVLVDEDGRQVARYFTEDRGTDAPPGSDETLQAALAVIGAWSDLDWEEFSTELDRIRHESQPTPPIDLDV